MMICVFIIGFSFALFFLWRRLDFSAADRIGFFISFLKRAPSPSKKHFAGLDADQLHPVGRVRMRRFVGHFRLRRGMLRKPVLCFVLVGRAAVPRIFVLLVGVGICGGLGRLRLLVWVS